MNKFSILGFVALIVAVMLIVQLSRSRPALVSEIAIKDVPTLATLVERASSEQKVIYLLFGAVWCQPCTVFKSRVLDTPQAKAALKSVVYREIDTDEDKQLALRFGISPIPVGMLLVVRDDKLVVLDSHVGGLGLKRFLKFINRHVNAGKRIEKQRS